MSELRAKIFWIDKPVAFQYRNDHVFGRPLVDSQKNPGWFYEDPNGEVWDSPFKGHEKIYPRFDLYTGDKLLTRNGSIIVAGRCEPSSNTDYPNEVDFWVLKDTEKSRDFSAEGTL